MEVIAVTKRDVILGAMNSASNFGPQLKSWRTTRGQSQMALALAAGVSTRHVSYLETGKASPSREMVVQLTQAMDVPLRARNQLLAAAGFAPLYAETDIDSPAIGPVREALQFVLGAMEPNPTFIVNRRYEVIDANEAGKWVLETFTAEPERFCKPINMAQLIVRPEGMHCFIQNREEVQRKVLGRLRRDLRGVQVRESGDEELLAEIEPVLQALGVPRTPTETLPLIAGLQLKRGEIELNLFTTIATIGTAQDVTLQELRIETLFPSDDRTRAVLAARPWRYAR